MLQELQSIWLAQDSSEAKEMDAATIFRGLSIKKYSLFHTAARDLRKEQQHDEASLILKPSRPRRFSTEHKIRIHWHQPVFALSNTHLNLNLTFLEIQVRTNENRPRHVHHHAADSGTAGKTLHLLPGISEDMVKHFF
jgi:hypothetical protein